MGTGSSIGTPVGTPSREPLNSRLRRSYSPLHSSTSSPFTPSSHHSASPLPHSPASTDLLLRHGPLSQRRPMPSPPHPPLSEEQRQKVYDCLSTLELALEEFGLHFDIPSIMSKVVVTTQEGVGEADEGTVAMSRGSESVGIFVVDEGTLEVSSTNGGNVLYKLLPGDFFGELSTLFKVQHNLKVTFIGRTTLLQLPSSVVHQYMEGALGRGAMLKWCIKRSIFDTSEVFDSTIIAQKILVSCFKASLLSEISDEAIDFVASLAKPVLFSEGDTLCNVGDDPCYIYFVLRGQLERYTESEELLEPMMYVRFSDEGFTAGAKQFFSRERLPHMIKAAGPVLVAPIGREILLEMTNKYPNEIVKLRNLLQKYTTT